MIIFGSFSIVLFGMLIAPLTSWVDGWVERAAKAVLIAIGRRRSVESHLLHAKLLVALCACHAVVAIGAAMVSFTSDGWRYWEI